MKRLIYVIIVITSVIIYSNAGESDPRRPVDSDDATVGNTLAARAVYRNILIGLISAAIGGIVIALIITRYCRRSSSRAY
jgi:hypothetical protein